MRSEHLDGRVVLHGGDSRDVLKGLADCSIDSVVTDPPYALVSIVKRFGGENAAPANDNDVYSRSSSGFMGRTWDTGETAFAVEFWAEIMRVLKPGGHVVAFSGTRTYHRLAVAIEDAGFEIRDQLAWVYGSGFPKSHDAAQSIEKLLTTGKSRRPDRDLGGLSRDRFSGSEEGTLIANTGGKVALTTPEARQWQGWGTALKPAWEPIVMARKPLGGTVAANILRWGAGALNIDGCRVEGDMGADRADGKPRRTDNTKYGKANETINPQSPLGRWPANIVHDGSDEVVAGFPDAPGQQRAVGPQHGAKDSVNVFGDYGPRDDFQPRGDSGSAARFFYSAKADKQDRIGSKHPTVKPVDLMQWLCRLVTPPGGTVLDPFAGSGSTGEAAWREGFQCVLIEREAEYQADIAERLRLADKGPLERRQRAIKQTADIGGLFANDNGASQIAA